MEQENIYKKNNVITIILVSLVLGLGAYIVYDKVLSKKVAEPVENVKQDNSVTYKVSDYITVTDFALNQNCSDCATTGTVKKVDFKNLPLRTTTEFSLKHNSFIYPSALESASLKNEVSYEVNNNVLSVFEKDVITYAGETIGSGKQYNYYSLNVNLKDEKTITNQELLELYNVEIRDMYEKILNNIANTVSIGQLLMSTTGDVDAEKVTIEQFKENVKTYAGYIDNRFDVFSLYIKDGKVYAVYEQNTILSILGMGSHMGAGLVEEPQTVQLN